MRARVTIVTLVLTLALTLGRAHAAVLGNPGEGQLYSGIGVISGWKCEANGPLTVRFNGGESIPLVYGSQRPDVLEAGACSHDRAGFVAIWNWARLGDGRHTAVVYDNGVEFDRSTFTVTTLGEEFVQGVTGQTVVPDFPRPGTATTLTWNPATQGFELAAVQDAADPTAVCTTRWLRGVAVWFVSIPHSMADFELINPCNGTLEVVVHLRTPEFRFCDDVLDITQAGVRYHAEGNPRFADTLYVSDGYDFAWEPPLGPLDNERRCGTISQAESPARFTLRPLAPALDFRQPFWVEINNEGGDNLEFYQFRGVTFP